MTQQETFENLTVVQLRARARELHVPFPAGIKKQEMIARLVQALPARDATVPAQDDAAPAVPTEEPVREEPVQADSPAPAAETVKAQEPVQAEDPAPQAPRAQMYCPTRKPLRPAVPRMTQPTQAADSAADASVSTQPPQPPAESAAPDAAASTDSPEAQDTAANPASPYARRSFGERRPARPNPALPQMLESNECGQARGILDIQPDGYGFLRAIDPDQKDVYVSVAQIRRFALRNGDLVCGRTRPERENERYLAMLFISTINGLTPEDSAKRPQFENLTPIYPNRRLRLEDAAQKTDLAIRLLDLVAPIGYGQRGLIVSPPKAGKTTLIKEIAAAVSRNAPNAELIVLLIDERPEEVTDMMRSVKGQVYYSTFDQDSAHHITVAEQTLEKARRSVENGQDVILLLDSITRLARAANLTCTPSGRLLSGGLDPAALAMPKRFFGSARCLEEGGSLTILATALVDTGSRLDDIIYEEFKGTGNMELHLDRRLQERRVFPAIDLYRSGTRHEEQLLTADELSAIWKVRKLLSGNPEDATELMIDMMAKTASNDAFIDRLESWLNMMDARNIRK